VTGEKPKLPKETEGVNTYDLGGSSSLLCASVVVVVGKGSIVVEMEKSCWPRERERKGSSV
jgi:hypothetical protein